MAARLVPGLAPRAVVLGVRPRPAGLLVAGVSYDEADEEGEAFLYRLDAKAELEQERQRRAVVDRLIDSLVPGHATMELFTFEERRFWGLKRHRKYLRDHE